MPRLKLRHLLFLLLLLAGIVPVVISSIVLLRPNQEILRTQEETKLSRAAEAMSRDIDNHLVTVRKELEQLGRGLLAPPGPAATAARLQEPWVAAHLRAFSQRHSGLFLWVLDPSGQGPQFVPGSHAEELREIIGGPFDEALASGETTYRLVTDPTTGKPAVVLSVPIADGGGGPALILTALTRPPHVDPEATRAGDSWNEGEVFLLDGGGELLWYRSEEEGMAEAVLASPDVRQLLSSPSVVTSQYDVAMADGERRMIGTITPLVETDWRILVQKPEATAFVTVRRMVLTVVLASLVLVLLALVLAFWAAGWIGQPIQRLADTSHDIAQGDFGSRVETAGLHFEIADLARDFNLMGGYVQGYIEKLERAAQANRDLFIGSLKALTAAVDAKDPYTRGHSERVATLSRTIATHMGLNDEFQSRIWIGALLHDVGKIGIDDRVLKKGGVLTPEEYEQMKLHPVIGADIMAPIEQLKEMLPAIRWHHEAWNGRGYPDGLKGEGIPLTARIVAVADSFDAITTNRPYQKAYDLEYAVETITKLAGSRFDAKVVTAFLRAFERGEIQASLRRMAEEAEHPVPAVAAVAF